MGTTLLWLSLIVLIPLAALFLKATELSPDRFVQIVTSARVLHALELSFGLSLAAAVVNLMFGFAVVWALVRYDFPGRRLFDAVIDIPFALPTAVAGIALTSLYSENGWIGSLLAPLGIQVAFTPLGIFVALVFVGLPFVVRTVQPVLEDLEVELEEVSATASSCRSSARRCSPASRSPSRGRSATTARSSSLPATCRTCPR
jgi:sulfate transport system permease protein